MRQTVTSRIDEFLQEMGVKKVHLANMIGMQQGTLNAQLNGSRQLPLKVLVKILEQFPDLNKEWLFEGKGKMLYSQMDSEASRAELLGRIQQLEDKVSDLKRELIKKEGQVELLKSMIGK